MTDFLALKIVLFCGMLFTFTFMIVFGIGMALKDSMNRTNRIPPQKQHPNFTVTKLVLGTTAKLLRKRWLGW